jgi:hypothetical protein
MSADTWVCLKRGNVTAGREEYLEAGHVSWQRDVPKDGTYNLPVGLKTRPDSWAAGITKFRTRQPDSWER